VAGLVYLALAVNLLTSVIGAVTLISYLFIYTPLKRVTWLNTLVGAVPGALPPLMGWTAARGELSGEGWALFAILAFWQIPAFHGHRLDVSRRIRARRFQNAAGVDPDGRRTAQQAVSHTLALLVVSCVRSLSSWRAGLSGGRAGSGRGLPVVRIQFSRQLTLARARQLFLASIFICRCCWR
jgi:heme o synthase